MLLDPALELGAQRVQQDEILIIPRQGQYGALGSELSGEPAAILRTREVGRCCIGVEARQDESQRVELTVADSMSRNTRVEHRVAVRSRTAGVAAAGAQREDGGPAVPLGAPGRAAGARRRGAIVQPALVLAAAHDPAPRERTTPLGHDGTLSVAAVARV